MFVEYVCCRPIKLLLAEAFEACACCNAWGMERGIVWGAGEWIVAEAEIALGGVAPRTIMAPLTMDVLKGRPWNKTTLHAAIASLAQDVYINSQSPGLLTLASSYWHRLTLMTMLLLQKQEAS